MDISYLAALHTEVRQELVRVDTKISVLLQTFMVTVSVVVAGAVAGQWNPTTELGGIGELLWWVGVALIGGAVVLLLFTLNPVTSHADVRTEAPRYYGDVKRYNNKTEFREGLDRVAGAAGEERLVDQTYLLSHLVSRKYSNVHWATGMFVGGAAVAVFGALAG